RPVRIACMNVACVHLPRPVSASGVRFAVKLTPHAPDHAVFVCAPATTHGPGGNFAGCAITMLSGCPESMRLMSGSGPAGPTCHGVWQSLQALVVTKYLPRAILAASPSAARAGSVASVIAP